MLIAEPCEMRMTQVAVLGGQIGAMSKKGRGSIFWFTVPLLLPDSQRARTSLVRFRPSAGHLSGLAGRWRPLPNLAASG